MNSPMNTSWLTLFKLVYILAWKWLSFRVGNIAFIHQKQPNLFWTINTMQFVNVILVLIAWDFQNPDCWLLDSEDCKQLVTKQCYKLHCVDGALKAKTKGQNFGRVVSWLNKKIGQTFIHLKFCIFIFFNKFISM